jgi:outer membrane protein assembly factor BamE (lipoprotein component of BamABCDE complex)
MDKFARAGLLIALLYLLSGCAGKDFVRPSADAFKLGQTTYSQVVRQLGEPGKAGDVLKNGKQVKSITYSFASAGGEALEEGVIPARALAYFFYNDSLVGQEFISSFKSDNSNFDEKKIDVIKKGQTTRSDAIQLMGRPSASYVLPMVKETAGEAIGYTYLTTRGGAFSGFKIFSKILRISFDDKNLVSDIDYATSGNK